MNITVVSTVYKIK